MRTARRPDEALAPYRAEPGPFTTSIEAMSSLGIVVCSPMGRPVSASVATRPSSSVSQRVLNRLLNPRPFTNTELMPTCVTSSPGAFRSASEYELPMRASTAVGSMAVMLAAASVTFSAWREAETTTLWSRTSARSSTIATFAPAPVLTMTAAWLRGL